EHWRHVDRHTAAWFRHPDVYTHPPQDPALRQGGTKTGGTTTSKGRVRVIRTSTMHKAATVAILAAFLVSCASSPPPASTPAASATPGTGSSRYEMEHDSPLLEPFD